MRYFRKTICLLLVLTITFTLPLCVFATTNDAEIVCAENEEIIVINSTGIKIIYTFTQAMEGEIIEAHLEDGTLIERSVILGDTVTQEVANGEFDGAVYSISDCIIRTEYEEPDASRNHLQDFQMRSNDPLYDPPQVSDSGLTNSTVYSGYKFLGTTSPDSTYGVTVSVHRKLNNLGSNEAYRFTVSPGTTISTLAGILAGGVTEGLPGAVATGLATAFIGAGIDSVVTGKLQYTKYHYTYKFNCNNSTTCTYKCCECKEWWCIYDAQGNLKGYEQKNMTADSHLTINIYAKCQFVIQDYLNGVQTDVACKNAAA